MPQFNVPLVVFIVGVVGFGGGLLWLADQIRFSDCGLPVTADWIEELSAERYRPMLRVLHGDDLEFLSAQAGFPAGQAREFRMQRVRVFRGYLQCLRADFERVSMAIRVLMVQSRDDRPDLAQMLIRQRARFAADIGMVHLRLFLYRWGICGVDASGLMRSFEALRMELRALLPGPAAAHA